MTWATPRITSGTAVCISVDLVALTRHSRIRQQTSVANPSTRIATSRLNRT